jgi:hypothetical protein
MTQFHQPNPPTNHDSRNSAFESEFYINLAYFHENGIDLASYIRSRRLDEGLPVTDPAGDGK